MYVLQSHLIVFVHEQWSESLCVAQAMQGTSIRDTKHDERWMLSARSMQRAPYYYVLKVFLRTVAS